MTEELLKKRIMLCAVVFALFFSSFALFANVQKASAVQINKPWLIKTKIVKQVKKGNSFTWTSSNSSVASVSAGQIIAKSSGTCTITAKTVNGKTASCTVTIV